MKRWEPTVARVRARTPARQPARTPAVHFPCDSQGSDFIVLGWEFGEAQSEAAMRWSQGLKPVCFSALLRHD